MGQLEVSDCTTAEPVFYGQLLCKNFGSKLQAAVSSFWQ